MQPTVEIRQQLLLKFLQPRVAPEFLKSLLLTGNGPGGLVALNLFELSIEAETLAIGLDFHLQWLLKQEASATLFRRHAAIK